MSIVIPVCPELAPASSLSPEKATKPCRAMTFLQLLFMMMLAAPSLVAQTQLPSPYPNQIPAYHCWAANLDASHQSALYFSRQLATGGPSYVCYSMQSGGTFGSYGMTQLVPGLNDGSDHDDPCVLPDNSGLLYVKSQPGGIFQIHIATAITSAADPAGGFNASQALAIGPGTNMSPSLLFIPGQQNAAHLFFHSDRNGGGHDLFFAAHTGTGYLAGSWPTQVSLNLKARTSGATSVIEPTVALLADGSVEMVYAGLEAGESHLWRTTNPSSDVSDLADPAKWSNPVPISLTTVGLHQRSPYLVPDARVLYFEELIDGIRRLLAVDFPDPTTRPVTFAATPYAVGNHPIAVAVGDYDGDSDIDLAIANRTSGNVTFLINNGAGVFSPGTQTLAMSQPSAIDSCDFDQDGDLDLAVCDLNGDHVAVFTNDGSGQFSLLSNLATGGADPENLEMGDLNEDGYPDLVVANISSNSVSVFYFDPGTTTFGPTNTLSSTNFPFAGAFDVAIGDFSGDGKPDIAVINVNSDSIAILENQSGSFSALPLVVVSDGPRSLEACALNDDIHPDLVTPSFLNNQISLGINFNGSFSVSSAAPSGNYLQHAACGDFNRDGRMDVAASSFFSNEVVLTLQQSDGSTWAPQAAGIPVGTQPRKLACGDFNDDGLPDLAVPNTGSGNVTILMNTTAVPTCHTIDFEHFSSLDQGSRFGRDRSGDYKGFSWSYDWGPFYATFQLCDSATGAIRWDSGLVELVSGIDASYNPAGDGILNVSVNDALTEVIIDTGSVADGPFDFDVQGDELRVIFEDHGGFQNVDLISVDGLSLLSGSGVGFSAATASLHDQQKLKVQFGSGSAAAGSSLGLLITATTTSKLDVWGSWTILDAAPGGFPGAGVSDNWLKARASSTGKGAKITCNDSAGFEFVSCRLFTDKDNANFLHEVLVTWRTVDDVTSSATLFDLVDDHWIRLTAKDIGADGRQLKALWFNAASASGPNSAKFGLDDFCWR